MRDALEDTVYAKTESLITNSIMSEKEKIEFREKLDKALKESFFKMIDLKKKLGQTVIIADKNGMPIEVSAEEAERIAHARS